MDRYITVDRTFIGTPSTKPYVTGERIFNFDKNHLSSILDSKGHSHLVIKDEILAVEQILEPMAHIFFHLITVEIYVAS